jgi:large subunit ribosomal protein L23
MKDARDIILMPLITEKTISLKDKDNKYVFYVAPWANKIEIAKAVEELFKVKVVEVRTQNLKGKPKRIWRFEGRRKLRKKAICKLKPGDKIDLFGGT